MLTSRCPETDWSQIRQTKNEFLSGTPKLSYAWQNLQSILGMKFKSVSVSLLYIKWMIKLQICTIYCMNNEILKKLKLMTCRGTSWIQMGLHNKWIDPVRDVPCPLQEELRWGGCFYPPKWGWIEWAGGLVQFPRLRRARRGHKMFTTPAAATHLASGRRRTDRQTHPLVHPPPIPLYSVAYGENCTYRFLCKMK